MSLLAQLRVLESVEPLRDISFKSLFTFIRMASLLKSDILLAQPADWPSLNKAPDVLPPSIVLFLSRVVGVPDECIPVLWDTFKDNVWNGDVGPDSGDMFDKHGHNLGLTERTIYPPFYRCQNADCTRGSRLALNKAEQRQAVLYTLSSGPVPVYSVHLYCERCCINYHHNFQVKDGTRYYYDFTSTLPEIIQTHRDRCQSRFQLQERLQRARVAHLNDALPHDIPTSDLIDATEHDEEFDIVPSGEPAKIKIRAQFGRKWTHNEQIFVAPCGIIIARETLYNAEGIKSVADMIRQVYRDPVLMPNHIFYDNNCNLSKHVRGDPIFKDVGLTVDVFHFKSKHSEQDTYCQENCNPAAYPELKDGEEKWYFNSSIAEQTNVWLGGYHAICRELLADKYKFFLDEMILERNIQQQKALMQMDAQPQYW
ncbi:hypothetical protein CCMSSC00406_0005643 [Pleurotus cornucopiae]|uniref:Uncharacterized protein n=1 Tax=Pleurotus cornucopiae TaxID=5321 RepID=A0ACB7IVH7_PLECO|nr:hypothetical protein CCMSSC00406_0005643 [Pleurotus cornucopiae]